MYLYLCLFGWCLTIGRTEPDETDDTAGDCVTSYHDHTPVDIGLGFTAPATFVPEWDE